MTYITDGRLEIDNNASERDIKTFVIGRKNWLFFDQPAGATAGAMIYSLIQTCKFHNVEPYAYFRHVLATIRYAQTDEQLRPCCPLIMLRRQQLRKRCYKLIWIILLGAVCVPLTNYQ